VHIVAEDWEPLCKGLIQKPVGDENALQVVVLNQYRDKNLHVGIIC
jgi:hypothetical protein